MSTIDGRVRLHSLPFPQPSEQQPLMIRQLEPSPVSQEGAGERKKKEGLNSSNVWIQLLCNLWLCPRILPTPIASFWVIRTEPFAGWTFLPTLVQNFLLCKETEVKKGVEWS